MAKTLAVLTIHGMGEQRKDTPQGSGDLSFSKDLFGLVRDQVGAARFDAGIAWREAYWADILQGRQDAYAKKLKKDTGFGPLRSFVMFRLSDAASYNPLPRGVKDADSTYTKVHDRIADALAGLDADTGGKGALIVLAHSLGGYMMSNYIYDTVRDRDDPALTRPSAFQNLMTFAGFVTFGCNIPVFMFSVNKVQAIRFPGAPDARRLKPWWRNYYDADDPLGYPLAPLGGDYQKLADEGGLADARIDAGGLFTSWNPLSHNAYWTDRSFYVPVAKAMERFI